MSELIVVLTYVVLLGSTMDIQIGCILLLVDMPIDLHVAGLTSICNWFPSPSHKTSTFIHWREINLMKFIQMIMQNGYSSGHCLTSSSVSQNYCFCKEDWYHTTQIWFYFIWDDSPSSQLTCTLSVFHYLICSSLFLAYLGCGKLK